MGLPDSGKSILGEGVHRELEQLGFHVRFFEEATLRSSVRHWQADAFDFFIASVNKTIDAVLEAKSSADDVVLIERGIYDHIVSAKALQKAGLINGRLAKRVIGYLEPHKEKEELIIFLRISQKTSRDRDQNGDPTMPPGRIANPEFLKHLQASYKEVLPEIPDSKFLSINGEREIPRIRERALKNIQQKLQEGRRALTLDSNQNSNQKGGKERDIDVMLIRSLDKGGKLGCKVGGRAL